MTQHAASNEKYAFQAEFLGTTLSKNTNLKMENYVLRHDLATQFRDRNEGKGAGES